MFSRFSSLIRCPPTMIRAGSPGMKWTRKKTTEVMMNINGTSVTSRVTMSRVTAPLRRRAHRPPATAARSRRHRALNPGQEAAQHRQVPLRLFQVGGVRALLEHDKLRIGDTPVKRL